MSFDFQFEEWLADSLRTLKSSSLSTTLALETPTFGPISSTSGSPALACTTSGDFSSTSAASVASYRSTGSELVRMGDGQQHGPRRKKSSGQSKSYYYALTYDEEDDSGSMDETGNDADNIRSRVANILAETELAAEEGATAVDGARLDFNDNLFGGDGGSPRNSRPLEFDLSDDDFQSVDSRSDAGRPEVETASVDEDFVRITRPEAEVREERAASPADGAGFASGQGSGSSPKTSGPVRQPSGSSSPLAVVYVKQKPMTELYDGNFIDDDILQPQEERTIARDNTSLDLLPMPVEEMTLEMDEEDDGIPDSGSGIDPIMFRKSTDRWCTRHRKLMIGVLVAVSVLVLAGLAVIIYFAVYAAR